MPTRKVVTVDMPELGKVVELREPSALTMLQYARNKSDDADDEVMSGFRQLSATLYVDGTQFSAEELAEWGPSIIFPLLNEMNTLFTNLGPEGND